MPDDVEVIGGDARDPAFTTAVAHGAAVVYQTLNPPYPEWTAQFPALQAGVLAAAEATGARLVSMENVYMYGRPAGRPLTEDRAYDAHTKKGQAPRADGARTPRRPPRRPRPGRDRPRLGLLRPRGGAQSNLGDRVFPAALAGKTATVLGDPDQPHTYTYIPDIGEGLAVLGEHPDAPGRYGTCPTTPTPAPPANSSTSSTSTPANPAPSSAPCPPLLLRGLGLFNPTMRELIEMQYQFEEPFIVDSSKIADQARRPRHPVDQALADTLATYGPIPRRWIYFSNALEPAQGGPPGRVEIGTGREGWKLQVDQPVRSAHRARARCSSPPAAATMGAPRRLDAGSDAVARQGASGATS